MIIYNVTVNIESDVAEEWVNWMKSTHIPDVMATGYFLENRFAKVLVEEQQGVTYSIQYLCKNNADLVEYQEKESGKLQAEHSRKYEGKFVAFRTLLEVVD